MAENIHEYCAYDRKTRLKRRVIAPFFVYNIIFCSSQQLQLSRSQGRVI
jgi:hypothetical protein